MPAPAPTTGRLDLFGLREEPLRWEAAVRAEQERAVHDPAAAELLRSIYCESDRAAAFERFWRSFELETTLALLARVGVRLGDRIVEIGGGPGWLGWALHRRGYYALEMLEPNDQFTTGTGYLRTRQDAQDIRIWNDLDRWYDARQTYDVVLTHNCVHHFGNISYVAACIRENLRPGGRWVMLREPYADTADDLYRFFETHPYARKYRVFEYAFPAAHYVDALELAGFRAEIVLPEGYANGTLATFSETPGGLRTRLLTRLMDALTTLAPESTNKLFRVERIAGLLTGRRLSGFSRPAAVVFRRVEVAK